MKWHGAVWLAILIWGYILCANPISIDPSYEIVTYNHCWTVHNIEIREIRGYDFEVDTWTEKCQSRTFYTEGQNGQRKEVTSSVRLQKYAT